MLLNEYMKDGANKQARAVLAMLQGFNIESSWNPEWKRYAAEIEVGRWENCREQGYVVYLRKTVKVEGKPFGETKQLNIAWYEHRNSDSIFAVCWEQDTINTPSIDLLLLPEGVMADKWDVVKSVGYGDIVTMADWIAESLTTWYNGD